jgi:DNA replication protein DnaC
VTILREALEEQTWLGFDAYCSQLVRAKERVAELSNAVGLGLPGLPLGLVLAGNPGSGKTHLARAVAWQQGPRAAMISEPQLLANLQAIYRGDDCDGVSEQALIRRLHDAPILILDDIGTGHVRQESRTWLESIYWRVLDERQEHGLSVLVTTNLAMDELGDRMGERASSRLMGLMRTRSNYVDLFGVKDYRDRGW